MSTISRKDYLRCLEPWVKASEKYLYSPPDRRDLICYGTGYNGWGAQTHQKAFAAFAVLAADPGLDEKRTEMSHEQVLDIALKMLRFTLESHIEGSYECMDGTSWGHTWISSLGIERMMHGVEAIEEHLTEQDHKLLRKMLISECDWLMDHYEIVAGPISNNKPESNLWNGCVLHRTAAMYPEAPRAEEYKEKGTRFLVNSISVASDGTLSAMMDGKTVSEWYIGNNFFDSYALNHHGYLNIGYSTICLSNIAMLHFMYRKKGLKGPDSLYHHVKDLWGQVKQCFFPDGRLIRIGGDTRVRYCYCQDYAIPVWLLMQDLMQDENCMTLESGWLSIVNKEMEHNGDGTFLSDRCSDLEKRAPLYYTRLESDRAVGLSYGAYWRRIYDTLPKNEEDSIKETTAYSWYDEYHGACYQKGEKRIASWTWRAGELPQGLCLPPDASDLAEWRFNLAGRIKGTGTHNFNEVISHKEQCFEGGFLTFGSLRACSEELVSEQQTKDILAIHKVVYAALPDDCTVVVMQHAAACRRSYLTSVQGVHLSVPNDLFNGNKRTYYCGNWIQEIEGFGSSEEAINTQSSWINIDERLSVIKVYGDEDLTLYRPGRRQIGLRHKHHGESMGMLYADEICCPFHKGLKDVDPGTVLIDTGFIVQSGVDHQYTSDYAAGNLCQELRVAGEAGLGRTMMVQGADNKTYILVANMGEETINVTLTLPEVKSIYDVVTNEEIHRTGVSLSVQVADSEVKLFILK